MKYEIPRFRRIALALGTAILIAGVGCAHVNREEMTTELDTLRTELRDEQVSGDEALARRIDGVETRIDDLESRQAENEARIEALARDLQELESEFGVVIERLENAIAFQVPVHFEYDSATLGERETNVLDRFAHVYGTYYGGGLITVEGFTDPAGSEAYNMRLGQRRAEEVRSYLTEVAGLSAPQVRAVSYGESEERLVAPGKYGPGAEGAANRRVVLVIEGTADVMAAGPGGGQQ